MNHLISYRFSLLGPGRLFFGPLMMIFGVGLLLTEKAQMVHRVANDGQIFGSPFDVVLWLGFAAIGVFCLVWGIWMLQSDRKSWVENGELHTVRGILPMFHQSYTKKDIRGYEISKQPITIVFNNRASTLGQRYPVVVLLGQKVGHFTKMTIVNCSTLTEAQSVKNILEREVGSRPLLTTL